LPTNNTTLRDGGFDSRRPLKRPDAKAAGFSVGTPSTESGQPAISRNNACECVGFSEIDRHAEAIYRYHWPEHRNYGDATAIDESALPDFDFLIAGFPCQAFSIAGKRQGFNEARGTLFFEIARILSHKRPSHFLLENVGGLRSHDGGKTMQRIFGILSDLGYFVEVPLLNSKDYGVPQNRERVFFIGHLADRCEREILSFGHDDWPFNATSATRGRSLSAADRWPDSGLFNNPLSQAREHGSIRIGTLRTHNDGKGFREMMDNNSPTIPARAREDGSGQPVIAVPLKFLDRNQRNYQGEYSFTVDTVNTGGVATDSRIRRLTPIECERLQGLPDNFTSLGRYGNEIKEVSDTQRYKGLGNSFTVNVIEAIVTRMIQKGCLAKPATVRDPSLTREVNTIS
jgi:DNA (cytosine-5)-methyltransferase 1